ncbi:MAG: XRE family transcriptional regulator [Betaproteobacteria bacterium]|nr:MAG: XRE family transcriptional regulator [Betaproteobacteria bacterium]
MAAYRVTAAAQLGQTLRGLRKSRDMSQVDVARASGLRQKTASLLETAPQRCSVDSLMRYLAAVQGALSLDVKGGASQPGEDERW